MFEPDVDPPEALATDWFHLEMLAPSHNERDHAAWMSSIEHIHATPGFVDVDRPGSEWPMPMTSDENLADLEEHEREFLAREAFAYSVLLGHDVIGCVYIDPDDSGASDAMVRCWVRASRTDQDADLAAAIDRWLSEAWPAHSRRWPGRPALGS